MNESNRPRLLRIVGEVAVIVVGVLIALAADEVRERSAERTLVAAYVESLATDLRADSTEFAGMLGPSGLPAQRDATIRLIEILSDSTLAPSNGTVLSLLRAQILLPFAKKRRATFDDMVGSGRLGLISDPDLRRDLVEYFAAGVALDQSGYDAYLSQSFFPFTHHLTLVLGVGRYTAMASCNELVGMSPDAMACYDEASLGDELELLRADPELGALVADQVMQQFFALMGIEQAQAQASALLARLDGQRAAS